jgi:pilus assembly protein FimV
MRAKPIFRLSLLAAALSLPGTAFPLGLGKLTVHSGLGQPLSAQIELTSATKEELDSLAARVADAALYRQNNLAFQSVLTRSRVSIERAPSGETTLKVTTVGSVNEPYLDLLIEANWAAGRIVRAYTFLLDPPGTGAAAAIEPVTPPRAGVAAPRAAAAPASAPATRPASEPATAAQGTYAVKRGDTLSKIASETKPASVTLEQMLVALFRSNESAFDGNNMNRLRAGAIITIPRVEEAGATGATEATKVVQVQSADWRAYRDRLAGAAPSAEGAAGRAAAGKIGAAVEEKAPAVVPGRDQLKVSREAVPAKGAAGEEVIAREKALKDAQTRIADLERTLKDLQRAIELKSQTAAQLQAQADAAKAKAPESPKVALPPVAAPAAPVAEPAKPAEPPKAMEAPKAVEPAKAPEPKAEAPAVPPPAPTPAPAVVPKPAPAVAPKPAAPEPSFFDDFFATTPMWAIGGGALLSLAGIAAIIAARRRKATKFEDSIISGTDIKTNTVFGSTGGGVVNTGENSLASEFSREGLGSIDTDEVDPIAEAEVYLAYGRDAQAEEILKDALKKDSQRQEIYLKLLEIHAQHNKPSAFETVAGELYSVCQGKGETWQKAVGLGRQLDPNNPMFSEAGVAPGAMAAGAGVVATVAAAAATVAVKPAAMPGAQPAGRATVPVDVASDMGGMSGLDMRLDEDISVAPTSGVRLKSPMDILAGAESELEKSTKSASASLQAAFEGVKDSVTGGGAATPSPSLEFHLDESERPAPFRSAPAREAERDEESTPAPSLARPQAGVELDKLDLSFDSERATFEDPTPSVLDGQWHDAATKLDLAKAYQEMGDVEGAREILQEVLHEGDDEQKTEAQSLLARLG